MIPGYNAHSFQLSTVAGRRDRGHAAPGGHLPSRTEHFLSPRPEGLMTLKVEELRLWYFHIKS